jgi:hypothetical protein
LEPGILFVERQFGILKYGSDKEKLLLAGDTMLKAPGLCAGEQLAKDPVYGRH